MTLDVFGINKLHETISGGKEWFSTSFNGPARSYSSGWKPDTVDPKLFFRLTNCTAFINNGQCTVTGPSPRIFIEGPWLNVEITCYVKANSLRYVHIGSRANHEVFDDNNNRCGFGRYNVQFNDQWTDYTNHTICCDKEVMHPIHIDSRPNRQPWPEGINDTTWTGLKTVTRTDRANNRVYLEGYVDHTGGLNGGNWIKKTEWYDNGTLAVNLQGNNKYVRACTGTSDSDTPLLKQPDGTTFSSTNLKQVWFEPGIHTYFRTEEANNVSYKWVSSREISNIS